MNQHFATDIQLPVQLLANLAHFRAAVAQTGHGENIVHGENLFSYCALERERLREMVLPNPLIGVVLSGEKEVWIGEDVFKLRAGNMFVLPAKVELEILNVPDERSGLYQSLILEVLPGNVPELEPVTAETRATIEVTLTALLVDAVAHAASDIARNAASGAVRSSRLGELIALLHGDPAARPLFDTSLAHRIALRVRCDLAHAWTAPDVASALGLSESTMRRRLAAEGLSFSHLLRRERMAKARELIDQGQGSQIAALNVGYISRAHFARHFREEFGRNPVRT